MLLKSWFPGLQTLTFNILMISGAILVMSVALFILRLYDSFQLPASKREELRRRREEAWEAVYLAISLFRFKRLWIAVFQKLLPALKSYRLHMPNYSAGLILVGWGKFLAVYALAYDGWDLARDIWSDFWSVLEDWVRKQLGVDKELAA